MKIDDTPSGSDIVDDFDRRIIREFLNLIKDKYPIVDKANFFLESKLDVSGSTIAMANQRDFLSHFCTFLTEKLTERQKLDQVSAAEEHLRRAVIESYHNALSLKLVDVIKLYKRYTEEVVPYQTSYPGLDAIPDPKSIRAILRDIERLQIEARDAKSRNKWDDNWEEGIKTYVEGFLMAEQLGDSLEDYLLKASQLKIKKRRFFWFYTGIISIILNIALIVALLIK